MVDADVLDRLSASTGLTVDGKQGRLVELALPLARQAVEGAARLSGGRPASLRHRSCRLGSAEAPSQIAATAPPMVQFTRVPPERISREVSGRVTVRLRIDTDGGVAGCAPVVPSGSRELDVRTCALLMKRARFEPAIGPDGLPTEAILHRPSVVAIAGLSGAWAMGYGETQGPVGIANDLKAFLKSLPLHLAPAAALRMRAEVARAPRRSRSTGPRPAGSSPRRRRGRR